MRPGGLLLISVLADNGSTPMRTFVIAICLIAMSNMARSSFSADHREAPALLFENGGDRSLDLNDLYVFRSPANRKNTVMIMTVNPRASAH